VGTSGAYCDGGVWVSGSSRAYKKNISELTENQALEVLTDLEPTSFTYTSNDEEVYLGFIAEDVPDLVATKDRKGLVAMDIVAVLTKVVQTQQKQINDLQEAIDELQR
jgi:UDP-N-acetyl-D-mannosaminuronate dehydrogenase